MLLALWSVGSVLGGLWYGSRTWRSPLAARYRRLLVVAVVLSAPLIAARSVASGAALSLLSGLTIAPVFACQYALVGRAATAGNETEAFTWVTSALVGGLAAGSAAGGVAISAGGVRLWVNGQELINYWTDHARTTDSGTITLQAGQAYSIKLEYANNTGPATADSNAVFDPNGPNPLVSNDPSAQLLEAATMNANATAAEKAGNDTLAAEWWALSAAKGDAAGQAVYNTKVAYASG